MDVYSIYDVAYNLIGEQGCKYLSKAPFSSVSELILSKIMSIKNKMGWEIRVASGCPRVTGLR